MCYHQITAHPSGLTATLVPASLVKQSARPENAPAAATLMMTIGTSLVRLSLSLSLSLIVWPLQISTEKISQLEGCKIDDISLSHISLLH